MTPVFVLGNGVSRKAIDLETLKLRGIIYGCNALYRDFVPEVLVATDRLIAEQIQNTGYSKDHKFYTRRPIPGLGGLVIPQQYFGFSSGPAAVGLAASARYKTVYLLGFDLGPSQVGKFNNVYADTEFYKKSSAVPTYTGNWSRQIAKVCSEFPKTSFIRVKGQTTADIAELNGVKNLAHMPMEDFLNRINNTKEL